MNWLDFRDVSSSVKVIEGISLACSKLGGPISKNLHDLLIQRSYRSVIDYQFDYQSHPLDQTDDLIYARQIQALVSKQDFLDLGIDKESVSFENFKACEEKCRSVNDRLSTFESLDSDVSSIIHTAQRKISQILGLVPSLASLDFSFGPGATTSVKKRESHPLVKFDSGFQCSRNSVHFMKEALQEVPLWVNSSVLPSGNIRIKPTISKLIFVPKTSKTFRSIGVEPTLNGFFQKGVGTYLKQRLAKEGLNLKSQTKNRYLAYVGSRTDELCTIDLSNASDTISYMTVLTLLPLPWVDFLDSMRSSEVVYKDVIYELERFSSMGNSYTFELESLIFYSLLYACEEFVYGDFKSDLVTVFGDDIICRRNTYPTLVKILEYFGFSVNTKKSFSSGPFRESCGCDYFNGLDIRPFYLETRVNDRILFVLHNYFFRNGENLLANTVLSFIMPHNILWGPDGFGDGHLIGTHRLRRSRTLKRLGYEGGVFDSYSLTPRISFKLKKLLENSYVYPSYSIYVRGNPDWTDPSVHDILPGSNKYAKLSIYTLGYSIFRKPSLDDREIIY
jgi:hypothetical protein